MSVNTYIVGHESPSREWELKRAAYVACRAADMEIPDDLEDYFGGCDPENLPGSEVDISGVIKGDPHYQDGALVDLTKLDKAIKWIRVYVS